MESLAVLVSIILLVILWLGPISILLSLVDKPWARVLGYISGGFGVAAGIWLAVTVSSTGGQVLGGLSLLLGAVGAFLNWRKAHPRRTSK